jgi:Flp pilus assembly protein CpaB
MLAPIGSGSGLQALVPPGMRAVTIEVNEFSGVAGLISPGCRVDVISTINDGRGGVDSRIAKTIVQNVKVTAVGQRTSSGAADAPPEMFKSVTILASLEDAEAIELASAMGRPRLVLRGGRDNEVNATAGVSMNDLKGIGGRPDTGTSAIAVAQPTTNPVAVVAPLPSPTTRPVQSIVQAETVKHRVVRVIRAGRVSMVSLTLDADQDDSGDDSENLAGKTGQSRGSGDAVGTTSDPFDSK